MSRGKEGSSGKVEAAMKGYSESAKRVKMLRESLGDRQVEFARRLKVTQPMVSAWEGGGNAPSAAFFLRLGNIAPYPDNLWFWEQAGVNRDAMRTATGKLRRERREPPVPGEIIRVPRFRETSQGRDPAGSPIPLPTELIPNPDSTECLCVDEHSFGMGPAPAGLYIVDASLKGTRDVKACGGRLVMVRYAPESRGGIFPEGLYAGRIRVQWTDSRNIFQMHAKLAQLSLGSLTADSLVWLSLGLYEDKEAMSGLAWEDREGRGRRQEDIWERVGPEFPFSEGVSILGIVLGCFWKSPEDYSVKFRQ